MFRIRELAEPATALFNLRDVQRVVMDIPADLAAELDALVREGLAPTPEAALQEALRLGIAAMREGRRGPFPRRPVPSPPPGMRDPGDDRPIEVQPGDVNWAP